MISLLEQKANLTTQKTVSMIYKEEREKVEDKVLINRFYKLRSKLHLHLLDQIIRPNQISILKCADTNFNFTGQASMNYL